MAHHKSAIKRTKQNEKKRLANKAKESKVKSAIKTLRTAIDSKSKDEAKKLMVGVQSLLAKLAKSSAMRKQTASRKVSTLATRIAKI